MKVRIDAGGREVEIECSDANVTADTIGDKALAIWRETAGAKEPTAAYGFTAQPNIQPDRYDWRMGEGLPTPVQA